MDWTRVAAVETMGPIGGGAKGVFPFKKPGRRGGAEGC